jgi:hypothetical protein
MRLPLELSVAGTKVNAVEADAEETQMLSGSVAEVGADSIKISTAEDEEAAAKDRALSVAADAKILLDDKPAKLADIKVGSEVIVRLSEDGKAARAVKATTVKGEDDEE